jgi:putative ABC transport system substrate-binding protein
LITVDRDPVKSGLVSSLARPGGNVTGLFMGLYEGKMLELLKEAQPKMSLAFFAGDAPDPSVMRAKALGLRIEAYPLGGPDDLDGLYAAIRKVGADGVLVAYASGIRAIHHARYRRTVSEDAAACHRGRQKGLFEAGWPDGVRNRISTCGRRADQVVRGLKGANPADMAVELPTTFELFVNMTTAKAFGLTIPPLPGIARRQS